MTTKRRGCGTRSVIQRPDGLWEARASIGYENGKRQLQPFYGKTKGGVERLLREALHELDGGQVPERVGTTVGRFLEGWLETVGPRLRPATAVRYGQIVERQLTPRLGCIKQAKLQPSEVCWMLSRIQQDGLSPRTASHAWAVLRAALADAERDGIVARDVARLAHAPHLPPPEPVVLTPTEAQAVLDALPDPGLRRLATLAVHGGLRQAELVGLQWPDVDSVGGDLHVRNALQRARRQVSVGGGREPFRRAHRPAHSGSCGGPGPGAAGAPEGADRSGQQLAEADPGPRLDHHHPPAPERKRDHPSVRRRAP